MYLYRSSPPPPRAIRGLVRQSSKDRSRGPLRPSPPADHLLINHGGSSDGGRRRRSAARGRHGSGAQEEEAQEEPRTACRRCRIKRCGRDIGTAPRAEMLGGTGCAGGQRHGAEGKETRTRPQEEETVQRAQVTEPEDCHRHLRWLTAAMLAPALHAITSPRKRTARAQHLLRAAPGLPCPHKEQPNPTLLTRCCAHWRMRDRALPAPTPDRDAVQLSEELLDRYSISIDMSNPSGTSDVCEGAQ